MYLGHTPEVTIRTMRETFERKDLALDAKAAASIFASHRFETVSIDLDGSLWVRPFCASGHGPVSPRWNEGSGR
jgi:hypothetical protein